MRRRQQCPLQQPGFLLRITLLTDQQIANGIRQNHGAMGQALPVAFFQHGNESIILIKPHFIGIGKHLNLSNIAGGIVSDVHGGSHRQHRDFLLLAGIECRRQLRIPECIHHTVIAYPVTGTKILMGWIVKHTPAETACMASISRRRILNPGMAHGMLLPSLPGIEGFRGEHMTIVLRNQQGFVHIRCHPLFPFRTGIGADVREVIESINIFQKMTFFKIPHTGSGPAGIQLMSHLVGTAVKLVTILAFVDPHTPQHNARVVPVLQHHFPGILHRLVLPGFVANMLPAGNLRKDQQTNPVAFV